MDRQYVHLLGVSFVSSCLGGERDKTLNGYHSIMMGTLTNIAVVLVEPKTPGNIGSVARVMKNTGLSRLILVNPVDLDLPEARWMAHASGDILSDAHKVFAIEEALADATMVIGTTHQTGRRRGHLYTPKEVAREALSLSQVGPVALVFGPEDRGLLNAELELCHILGHVPCASSYPSLNLSHAVMVFAYEIYVASLAPPPPPSLDLASFREVEHMYRRIDAVLTQIGFIPRNTPTSFMRSVRRVFGRTRLERRDVATIHKICNQIGRFAARHGPKNNETPR